MQDKWVVELEGRIKCSPDVIYNLEYRRTYIDDEGHYYEGTGSDTFEFDEDETDVDWEGYTPQDRLEQEEIEAIYEDAKEGPEATTDGILSEIDEERDRWATSSDGGWYYDD